MTTELLKLKIKAFLHDPPEKAGILLEMGVRHEEIAEAHINELLGEAATDSLKRKIGVADHIASGADRYNFPELLADGKLDESYPFNVHFLDRPVLRHPLSGAILELAALAEDKSAFIAGVQKAVSSALLEIKERYGSVEQENRRLRLYYLSLWRELVGFLQQNEPPEATLGALWQRLPTETRMPDHSIWEHLSLVSALSGARIDENGQSNAALLLFSIGPVQSFISASRKTTDLWAGSYMLSLLSWQAMKVFCKELGPDSILFPDLLGQPLVDKWLEEEGLKGFENAGDYYAATLPNRFLAVVPMDKIIPLTSLAEEKVRQMMVTLGFYGLDELRISKEEWREQLYFYPSCHWASLPLKRFSKEKMGVDSLVEAFEKAYPAPFVWDNKRADQIIEAFDASARFTNVGAFYGRLYGALNGLLGARKLLRNFDATVEGGYRCSLHPDLAAITPKLEAGPQDVREYWDDKAGSTKMPGRIRKGERLSAIAVAKRFFPRFLKKKLEVVSQFPSTSSFASADYKLDVVRAIKSQAASAEDIRSKVTAFTKAILPFHRKKGEREGIPKESTISLIEKEAEGLGIDEFLKISGSWLFEETYQFTSLDKEYPGWFAGQDELDTLKSSMLALLKSTDKAGIERPSKYYAVLLMDGDKMGEWLAGKHNVSFGEVLHPDVISTLHEKFGEGMYEDWKPLLEDDYKRPSSPSLHLAISRSLKFFALERVRHIVESQFCGRVVYAGGDDVMALTSFRSALPTARTLRAAFSGHIDEEGIVNWEIKDASSLDASMFYSMGPEATASTGVVYAHRQQSLQQVLQAARVTEQFAKGKRISGQLLNLDVDDVPLGRNALAITVMKRNGEPLTAGTKWLGADGATDLVRSLDRFSALIRSGYVSTSFVYDLKRARFGLSLGDVQADEEFDADKSIAPALVEAFRLFARHSSGAMTYPGVDQPELSWLRDAVEEDAKKMLVQLQGAAFRETVGLMLNHVVKIKEECTGEMKWPKVEAHLKRVIRLLEIAQFIGKGGAR